VKKYVLSIWFLCGITFTQAQQWKAGVVWPALQFNKAPLNHTLALDSTLQDKRYFRMDELRPATKTQTDWPGLYLLWENRNRLFLRTELRVSSAKFHLGPLHVPNESDTNFIGATWTVTRPMITAECGYLLGRTKTWHPFVAAGISVSVFRFNQRHIPTYGYTDYDASNYYNYFTSDPWFLSLHLRAGIQRKAFSFSTSFKTSLTPVDEHSAISKVRCWSFIEIGWHFYQSGFFGKKQYEENTGTSNIEHTVQVDLKKSGASTGLRLPVYGFIMNQPYVDAWQQDKYNYVAGVKSRPEQRLNLEVFANNVKAFNARKTLYYKTEYGLNLLTILYPNAIRKSIAVVGNPDMDDRNDLVVSTEDEKHRYIGLFYDMRSGYRMKTGKKTFLYGDLGLRFHMNLNRYKKATEIPYIKKGIIWLHPEIGFQAGHKGIQLGLFSTLTKPDGYRIYKNIHAFYLGIYHEIYSK
jgi:hypothetical protein